MYKDTKQIYSDILKDIKDSGLWKNERIITTPQSSRINTTMVNGVLNMCANNYLGLADNKKSLKQQKQLTIHGDTVFHL